MNSNEGDLFSEQTGSTTKFEPITLELKGIVVNFTRDHKQYCLTGIPTFKNSKRMMSWLDKARKKLTFFQGSWWVRKDTIKIQSALITLPQHQEWMDQAIRNLESQLRSALQLTDKKIQTVASPRSWIASRVPLDDAWTWCPEIILKSEKCEAGNEGATILIERIK
jgi:hypothetical protein